MTELEKFEQVWDGYHRFNGQRGQTTKKKYENILFSIWKHHPHWEGKKGFQIKCRNRTIYRVLDLAEKAGLLIKVGNYSVGRFTRQYKKNNALFDMVFRNQNNKYGAWLKNFNLNNINTEYDIVHYELLNDINRVSNTNMPYVATSSIMKNRKYKKLNYDLAKLHILCKTMLPYYYNLREQLNNSVCHPDLKFYESWLKFTDDHLPTGRPYSYFCSTLNRKKKHKTVDPSMEYRDDFLKRIGLPDYYEVYDIKSEIPRINYLFHTGEWKGDNYDFYTEIINDYQLRMPDEDRIARGKAGAENYNDSMKQLFMRMYFGKGSEKQSYNGYKDEYMKRNKSDWNSIKNALLLKLFPAFKEEDFYPYSFDEWYEICCSTEKICGKSIGNLIFWYSFFLETEVKIELLNQGKKVYNVYDGFYYNQNISAEIEELLNEKALFIYKNYMEPIHL
jgi:hypothetical protein